MEAGGSNPLTPLLTPDTSITDFADDVIDAARQFAEPPILVGHSMGALVFMLAAQKMRTAGLILVAPSPPGNLPGTQRVASVPLQTQLRAVRALPEVKARFLGDDPTVDAQAYAARLCPESPVALNERYELTVSIDPQRVRVPVLVLEAGWDDPLRHPAGQDAGIAAFLGGTHVLAPDALHCLMVGRAALPTARRVFDWVMTVWGGSGSI